MVSDAAKLTKVIFLVSLFCLLPLWNIPHTIAARYLFAGLILTVVVFSNINWKGFFSSNKILLVFYCYLLIHLAFFSTNFKFALSNFLAQWMKLILFSLLGAGAGSILAKEKSRKYLLYMGLGFSFPLLVHLGLSIQEGLKRTGIPWGYWGINEIHGDLGYTAIHATVFLSAFSLYQAKLNLERAIAAILLIACIASPLVASSRGGTAFAFISLILILLVNLAIKFKDKLTARRQLAGLLVILTVLTLVFKIGSIADPGRWNGIESRLEMGLKGDPIKINCDGVGVLRSALEAEGRTITPELSRAVESIGSGDGSRVMTARAALALSAAYPMGIDQSKEAYQIAIARICEPTIVMSHAHDGWIDTALAIGIPGAILYFLVLANFARLGLLSIQSDVSNRPYAVALFVLSVVWIVRAFFDSTQRDQMLEMQVFTIALMHGFIVNNTTHHAGTEAQT
jgi:hypothetical protein